MKHPFHQTKSLTKRKPLNRVVYYNLQLFCRCATRRRSLWAPALSSSFGLARLLNCTHSAKHLSVPSLEHFFHPVCVRGTSPIRGIFHWFYSIQLSALICTSCIVLLRLSFYPSHPSLTFAFSHSLARRSCVPCPCSVSAALGFAFKNPSADMNSIERLQHNSSAFSMICWAEYQIYTELSLKAAL